MNKLLFLSIIPILLFAPIIAHASSSSNQTSSKSKYDDDGFTIFPTKSGWYMVGYRDGVAQAADDVKHFDERDGVDARPDHIVCPRHDLNPDYCLGYKDGYSDEAMDQLE